jgi:hypothetical protein
MASSSLNNNQTDVPQSPPREHAPILSPVDSPFRNREIPAIINAETDSRDGHEASPFTEEDDDHMPTDRQLEKQPRVTPEKAPKKSQSNPAPPPNVDLTAIFAAIQQTNELVREQSKRIAALEDDRRR